MRISPITSYTFNNPNKRYMDRKVQPAQYDTVSFSGNIQKFVKPEPASEFSKKIMEKILKYVKMLPDGSKLTKPVTIKTPMDDEINKIEIFIDKSKKNNTCITVINSTDHYMANKPEEMCDDTFQYNIQWEKLILKFNKDGQLESGEHLFDRERHLFERDSKNKRKITSATSALGGHRGVYIPDKSTGVFRESRETAVKYDGNASAHGDVYRNRGGALGDIFMELIKLKTSIFAK